MTQPAMNCRYLAFLIGCALVASSYGQVQPYSRVEDLAEVNRQILAHANSFGVTPASLEERRVNLTLAADIRYVHALGREAHKSGNADALAAAAQVLSLKWQTDEAAGRARVVSSASAKLLDFSVTNEAVRTLATDLSSRALVLLPEVPLSVAGLCASMLSIEHTWVQDLPTPSLLDLQPRANGLNGMLALAERVDGFMRNFSPEAALAKLPRDERLKVKSGEIPVQVDGHRLSYEEQSRYRDLLNQLQDFRYFAKTPPDGRGEAFTGHQGKLEKAVVVLIRKRYTLEPGDLDEVQLALDKYARDPALKERLVLAAYKGTNPFTGRTPTVRSAAEGKAKASASAGKAASQQGTAVQSVEKTPVPAVAGQPPAAADSGPLATTSGVSIGNSMLWLAFTGASALIVFVLWRAQARAHPRQTK